MLIDGLAKPSCSLGRVTVVVVSLLFLGLPLIAVVAGLFARGRRAGVSLLRRLEDRHHGSVDITEAGPTHDLARKEVFTRRRMQTQIEIPDNLLHELYKRAPRSGERSLLIGKILNEYFISHPERQSDLDLINQNAEELNREAEDVLDYQVIP